ncbi:hypothetical protein DKX38_016297 [Salix brachista]|uniref:Yip1 domain-containing protein n=1 Tax=Salix brachista TaxID=2182728 RepID=A0A5N5L7L4_9ROSI|nr:hypothetical protein DKX38_016297 [Salix brachista]
MASSSHRQKQLSLIPRDTHSRGCCITHEIRTSTSIEGSKKKETIATRTTHKLRPISKGNHIALEQEVVNRKKKTIIDKQKQLVREEKHEVREKKIVNYIKVEEKKRIPHKHGSGPPSSKWNKKPKRQAIIGKYRDNSSHEAVVTEGKEKAVVYYEDPEASMQTFPTNINGFGGRGYQTLGSPPEEFEQQQPNNWKGIFSVSSYMQYFNVDTDAVINRLMSSLYPIGGDFFSKIDANPDLKMQWQELHDSHGRLIVDFVISRYGPVWVSTTLIFVLASLGNLATYLIEKHTDHKASWSFDVGYVNVAVFSVYGYSIVVTLAFYFLLRYLKSNPKLIQLWCMWGYSLFIFIPSSFLLVIPIEVLRWIIVLAAGIDSGMFVASNLKTLDEGNDLAITVVAAFLLQLALAIFFKAWFFH